MINLKLAEYDLETGKFKEFLEIKKNFYYGGDVIIFPLYAGNDYRRKDSCGNSTVMWNLDEKDPLNRFDGLFDGRTYGEGRFVLVWEADSEPNIIQKPNSNEYIKYPFLDDVIQYSYCDESDNFYIEELTLARDGKNFKLWENNYITYDGVWFELVGNLHENPELYDEVK